MKGFVQDVGLRSGVKLGTHSCDHLRVGVVGEDAVCDLGGAYQWRRPSFDW